MTKAQRQVVRRQLLDEKAVLSQLRKDYKEALSRVDSKIQELIGRKDLTPSVIYQVRYQRMVKGQIEEALGNLRSGACQHISDYTEGAYKTAFIGAQYSMQKQGVPLVFPIDRDAMVKAIKTDSKLSSSMYRRMGVNVTELRNSVSAELSRGIASGNDYAEIARSIDGKFDIGMKNSMRIAQTEGHRISQESALDAMRKAKEAGADIVKQWDSTLDDRTRESHRELNGQIRDIDDCFETGDGHKALAPGQFGIPGEDINCRCVILQRARWAVEDGEGGYTKASRMEEKGRCRIVDMSSADGYQAFWNRYQAVMSGRMDFPIAQKIMTRRQERIDFTDGSAGVFETAKATVYTLDDGKRLVFKEGMRREDQPLTVDDLLKSYNQLPERLRNKMQDTINVVDYYNPADVYWKGMYKYFSRSYATGGQDITFYKYEGKLDFEYLKQTLCHETGHKIDIDMGASFKANQVSESKEWKDAVAKDTRFSGRQSYRQYGTNSDSEDFADSVAYYTVKNDDFKKVFPNRSKLLKLILGY